MIRLPHALAAWNTPAFAATLKRELTALDPACLPLQAAVSASSVALDAPIEVMVLDATADAGCIQARVGVLFSGIVAGCNCADDPTPVAAQPEYCELLLAIDRSTAATTAALIESPP